MSIDEELKKKSKMSLEEMFSEEKEKKDLAIEVTPPVYPFRLTFMVNAENYTAFHRLHSRRVLEGYSGLKKVELFNEIMEFYFKHHTKK